MKFFCWISLSLILIGNALQADHKNGTSTSLSSFEKEQKLINFVENCIRNAEMGRSKLSKETLKVEGMSSPKVRHFLNNLCSMPNTTYLEVGIWKGSTFIAALYGNEKNVVEAIGIDNWSLFGGPREKCMENCKALISKAPYHILDEDCFAVDKKELFAGPVTVYFFDGDHTPITQEKAFTFFNEIFDDLFVAVVDDWNWADVQTGTREAFKKLNYEIIFERALPARYNGDKEQWWNGLFVAIIKKKA